MRQEVDSSTTLRILMLEDIVLDAELCEQELKRSGLKFSAERVDTKEDFERALKLRPPALILSDFSMPRFDGLSALDIARVKAPATPFIFVSGTIGEERAVEAMKRGATDYVLKEHLSRLVPVVKRALQEQNAREALSAAGKELDQTRDRLERILASMADVVWSLCLSPLEFLYANDATEALFGRPVSDFFENPQLCFEVVHPDDRSRVMTLWDRTVHGESFDTEHRIFTPQGEQRWLHVRAKPVRDEAGVVARVDGIARDVTERRTHEERIARLSRVRSVLSGIDAAIVRVRDKQQLYADACHIAVHHGGIKLAWIGEVEPGTIDVRAHVHCGEQGWSSDHPMLPASEYSSTGCLAALVGQAVSTGRVTYSNDIASDGCVSHQEECLRCGYQSAAVVPLRMRERVTGVLALYSKEAGFFDEEERRLLDELSGNLSFALDYMDKTSRLDYLAYYDALTGLANRHLLFDRLAQLVTYASAERTGLALVVVDIARFRTINETMGTAAGDAVLTEVAQRLMHAAGSSGTCARVTADRFALTIAEPSQQSTGTSVALEHVLDGVDIPIEVDGEEVRVQVRAGIALYPEDGDNAQTLFANAEAALQNAKSSGERVRFYAREMNARVAELLKLENQLRVAVRERQFVLYYQPRVSLATGEVCGFEALIRWLSPQQRLVPPGDFIPLLEETGLILDVGRWALQQAAAEATNWRLRGLRVPPIGVNVSAVQLRERDFVDQVVAAVAAEVMPGAIDLELTESMVMADVEANARKLEAIRAAGIKIAIDDFGTGYSSLAYLASLPVDALKIDRSFVSSMQASDVHRALVTTVISLARSLGVRSVAEGVETREQAALLRLLGCDEAQGYLYSRPVPAEQAVAMLGRSSANCDSGHIGSNVSASGQS